MIPSGLKNLWQRYGRFVTLLLMAWAGAALAKTEPGVLRRPAELRESPAEAAPAA